MAYLINRNPAARFECLHALMKFLAQSYKKEPFNLKDVKYDPDDNYTVKDYCSLLKASSGFLKYCPFKSNPLDQSGCSLTNGRDPSSDSTKSKEVSNTINALHGLGFVYRNNREITITNEGFKFADNEYNTAKMSEVILHSILNYGPIIGMLSEIIDCKPNDLINIEDFKVGYPSTQEVVEYDGQKVRISSGSEKDSMTRTKSCLIAWMTQAGIIEPIGIIPSDSNFSQLRYRNFINNSTRNIQQYRVLKDIRLLLKSVRKVNRPLDYNNLTKLTRALRENNQEKIRKATIQFESIIKNRRFAIIYLLNESHLLGKLLSYSRLVKFLQGYPELFVINNDDYDLIINKELKIASLSGIPFKAIDNNGIFLKPLVSINIRTRQNS